MARTVRYIRPAGGRPDRAPPHGRAAPAKGRDIFRREERLRIAPKHPGMGRR